MRMACQPCVVYLLILLLGIIAHLCRCANHQYNEHFLEHEKICHYLHKRFTHEMRFSTAVIVRQHHMFDHWNVNADRYCRFIFKANKDEGILAVINKMFFRHYPNETNECLDYVRFKRSDGFYTNKFCGEIDRSKSNPSSDPGKPLDRNGLKQLQNGNTYAEYDPIRRSGAELETEIFISKEKVPDGRFLDLNIVYTPYKDCNKADQNLYKPVASIQPGHNICIPKQYICDRIYNCPLNVCLDEINCSFTSITDGHGLSREDTATEVTVGAITTVILCFIIFVMCLWICKRSQKLCWSSDCAGPNVCSRPNSLPQDMDGSASRAVPTAPMLEVAMPSSPVADKDLPPSYDSLFPEQSSPHESNPARS